MTTKPVEENVATLFGDVHYYYSSPAQNPPHHRFDKGSYVYLFENALERRARVEIANNAGTDDQDAVEGYLDKAYLRYSYKHQCLVSLTAPEASDPSEWHLPTYDPRNENKYHYKLHSVDVYFYTQADALQFVSGVRRVLPPAQVEVRDEPPPPPPPPPPQQQQQATGAPAGAGPGASAVVQQLEMMALGEQTAPANFTPMAYNPAAPAAPESIRPREKTPPPEDGGVDPLAAAVAYDQQPFTPGFPPPPPGPPGPPGPPQQQQQQPQHQFGQPHPGGLQRSSTMPAHAAGLASQQGPATPYGGPFQAQAPQGYAPQQPAGTPGAPPPPPPGPSQAAYAGHPQQAGPVANHPGSQQGYAVHQRVYMPDQAEQQATANQTRVEEQATRLERGVGGMFKKFEKRFG